MRIIQVVNWMSLVFAGFLVGAAIIFAYALLVPIDVVKNWKINSTANAYHPGDTVILAVEYEKVREVAGTSFYYLECKNPGDKLVRYPISQSEGNRPKGKGKIDLLVDLPSSVPNTPLQCRIAISVSYEIYAFRRFVENNQSNFFEVTK